MDWREYIQRPTVYAPPVADMGEVVKWMRARPGATRPGQYPTAVAEHAEAEAHYQAWRKRMAGYYVPKGGEKRSATTMNMKEYRERYQTETAQ